MKYITFYTRYEGKDGQWMTTATFTDGTTLTKGADLPDESVQECVRAVSLVLSMHGD